MDSSKKETPEGIPSCSVKISQKKKVYLFFKRFQDIFFSALALLILSPLILVVAIIIPLDSPGAGPFFPQRRIGKNGKEFKMYKFRSMYPDAEKRLAELKGKNEMDGPAFKIEHDPRITRFGKVLRKYNIDELPQLINIIKGEMSIVGPRPALPNEVKKYTDYEKQRLCVTPGLSCYWQIEPNRNKIKFSDWMKMDIQYIEDQSFLVDWKIIFKSIIGCLKGSGV
ncbi:MAG: sugar transferase [Clostridia bacterium]|nr:sugar transferase [Clostridia bacterium]